MKRSSLYFLTILCLLFSCGRERIEIEGFNDYIWKNDRFGCMGKRAEMAENLLQAKEKILGMRENEVLSLLGKADEQEIYSRNQKFLIYFLEPNAKCTAPEDTKATASALYLRLNALGVANEMYLNVR